MNNNYCVALQPICDREMRHVADELLYRSSTEAQQAYISDDMLATARVCSVAFYEVGLDQLVGQREILLNVSKDWILSPELLPSTPEQVIIEVLESVVAEPDVIKALIAIREKGYQVALDDYIFNANTAALLNVATLVKIDSWQNMTRSDVDFYKKKNLKLLAEKVEQQSDFEYLRDIGFDYFQGYFYARPQVHPSSARDRGSNLEVQIRILATLKKSQVNFSELENLIILDPELTFMLLRYTNNINFGLTERSISIKQALSLLGVRRVRAIVTTVMLANNGPASRLLLPQLLTRAAMCQHLAEQSQLIEPELAFTIGMLSNMDVLMGLSLEDLVKQLSLGHKELDALLQRRGALGKLLDTVEAFEKAEVVALGDMDIKQLNQYWLKSRIWAEDVLKSTGLN